MIIGIYAEVKRRGQVKYVGLKRCNDIFEAGIDMSIILKHNDSFPLSVMINRKDKVATGWRNDSGKLMVETDIDGKYKIVPLKRFYSYCNGIIKETKAKGEEI